MMWSGISGTTSRGMSSFSTTCCSMVIEASQTIWHPSYPCRDRFWPFDEAPAAVHGTTNLPTKRNYRRDANASGYIGKDCLVIQLNRLA
jgi:hypothetical protein